MIGRDVRVAIVTTSYPAHPSDAAGHFVRAHALELLRDGHAVSVFAPGAPLVEPDIDVHPLGGARLFGWPGAAARLAASPQLAPAFARFAARARRRLSEAPPFDRAFAHWLIPSVWPLADVLRAPIEGVAHGADVRLLCRLPSLLRRALVEKLVRRTDRLRFVARASLDALCEALPPSLASRLAAHAYVSPMPVLVPPRSSLVTRASLALPSRYVAWVGRLVPDKRVSLAVAASARAGVSLVVVGDGSVGRVPGPSVQWMGGLPRDEALAVIAHADALLHTSAQEAAPTVVREARALGVPVIACAAGDLEAWARDDRGIRLVPDDVTALARALRDFVP